MDTYLRTPFFLKKHHVRFARKVFALWDKREKGRQLSNSLLKLSSAISSAAQKSKRKIRAKSNPHGKNRSNVDLIMVRLSKIFSAQRRLWSSCPKDTHRLVKVFFLQKLFKWNAEEFRKEKHVFKKTTTLMCLWYTFLKITCMKTGYVALSLWALLCSSKVVGFEKCVIDGHQLFDCFSLHFYGLRLSIW